MLLMFSNLNLCKLKKKEEEAIHRLLENCGKSHPFIKFYIIVNINRQQDIGFYLLD